MYIPVDREGSPLSKVLDMVNIEEILKSTPLDSYERISPSILSGIVNKFAKYQLLNADNVKIGLVIHYKGGRTLALYLNDSIKTNFEYWQSEGIKIAEKLKKLTGNVWEIYCIRMEFPTRLSTAIVFSRDILQRVLDKYEEECTIWVDYKS